MSGAHNETHTSCILYFAKAHLTNINLTLQLGLPDQRFWTEEFGFQQGTSVLRFRYKILRFWQKMRFSALNKRNFKLTLIVTLDKKYF